MFKVRVIIKRRKQPEFFHFHLCIVLCHCDNRIFPCTVTYVPFTVPVWKKSVTGQSVAGRPIELFATGNGPFHALLLGGVHGDESEGYLLAEKLLENSALFDRTDDITYFICPRVNPDGCANNRRTNENNVDLNRNLPTNDWTGSFTNPRYYPGKSAGSEPETTATVKMLEEIKPSVIISLHSYEKPMINFNGESEYLALHMQKFNDLPPKGNIGYPTPGSLGTYAALGLGIPTITLEILRGQKPDEVWKQHHKSVTEGLKFYLK